VPRSSPATRGCREDEAALRDAWHLCCDGDDLGPAAASVFRAKYNSLIICRGHKKTVIALLH
jgi:hypothetical protein